MLFSLGYCFHLSYVVTQWQILVKGAMCQRFCDRRVIHSFNLVADGKSGACIAHRMDEKYIWILPEIPKEMNNFGDLFS
jgi:hypothetical protein